MKWIGRPVAEVWPFEIISRGVHLDPHFEGRGGRRASSIVPLERAMVVSYTLPIVTIALSLTIRPQFVIECLRRSIQQGVGHFVSKFQGFPLE